MFFIITGAVFVLYDVFLLVLNPGTFMDTVASFTHVWLLLGAYFIFVGVYRKKTGKSFFSCWKKWVKISVSTVCGLAFAIAAVNLFFILTPETAEKNTEAEYVILLGGGIDKNGNLSEVVESRVSKAAEYLSENEKAVCVVSGGKVRWSAYAEAPALKQSLIHKGINGERILVEDKALDTIQNLKFSCCLLEENEGKSAGEILESPVIIVTSRFHLARALRLAKRMGFKNARGLGSSIVFYKVPNSYAREICSYVKLNLRILLTGEPKPLTDDE